MGQKSKEDTQTLEELNLAHHHSPEKCQLVQTSYTLNANMADHSVVARDES